MSDNVSVPTSGSTISTDDIGGVQVQRVKVQFGVDGSATDASSTNPLPVDVTSANSSTGTLSNVPAAVASTTVLAANSSRRGAIFWNDSAAILYLRLGSGAASATSCSAKVPADGYYELPIMKGGSVYDGVISGIWIAVNGAVRVTEFT